jgi:hypothetical protein
MDTCTNVQTYKYFRILSNNVISHIIAIFAIQIEKKTQLNVLGTKTEMRYKLMGYGIPVSLLPDTDTGVVKVKNHIQWLKIRKQIENAQANICECPGLKDVLFRRAGSCLLHPGNVLFKDLLESIKDEHDNSNQSEKRDISWSIVEDIESRNGRFFKWCRSQTCWIQMTDRSEIRLKVAMSIRDFNRHAKAVQNRQSTKSSTDVFQNENKRKRKNHENNACILLRSETTARL